MMLDASRHRILPDTIEELAKLIGLVVVFWAGVYAVVGMFMVPFWIAEYLSRSLAMPIVAGYIVGWGAVTAAVFVLSRMPKGEVIAAIGAIVWAVYAFV